MMIFRFSCAQHVRHEASNTTALKYHIRSDLMDTLCILTGHQPNVEIVKFSSPVKILLSDFGIAKQQLTGEAYVDLLAPQLGQGALRD